MSDLLLPSAAVVASDHVPEAVAQREDSVVVRSPVDGGAGVPEERPVVPPHPQLHAVALSLSARHAVALRVSARHAVALRLSARHAVALRLSARHAVALRLSARHVGYCN